MRVEELIGLRIREQRERLGLSQEQLGQRVGDTLSRAWSRQAVSAAEKGNRAFTAADLLALVLALGVSVDALLVPPVSVDEVELSASAVLSRDDLAAVALPQRGGEGTPDRMRATLGRLTRTVDDMRAAMELAAADIRLAYQSVL